MYCITNEILKELQTNFITVTDEEPTLDELIEIRNKIGQGLILCKELYKKTGSVKEAVITYKLLYYKKKI